MGRARTRGPNTGISARGITSGTQCIYLSSSSVLATRRYSQPPSPRGFHLLRGALFSLAQPLPCHDFGPARDLPSASRGLQCPEGSQGIGEEALKAYCTRTLPSTHRSHADPTSLGGQENRKTHHLSNSRLSCLFNYSKNSKT